MVVKCVPVMGVGDCSGWPSGSTVRVGFNLGGSNVDVATRITVDPDGYLFIGGYADAAEGKRLAVAKLNAADGTLVATFGLDGKKTVALGDRPTGRDNNLYDMALVPASAPGGKRLYVVGNYKTSQGSKYSAHITWLDPANGDYRNSRTLEYSITRDNAITVIAVLANGYVAMAGWQVTINSGFPDFMLAKVRPDASLSYDPGFCGAGSCTVAAAQTMNIWPTAIGERPGNRDLVVGVEADVPTLWDLGGTVLGRTRSQVVQQYSASGKTLHAEKSWRFASSQNLVDAKSYPRGMLVYDDHTLVAGLREWKVTGSVVDNDVTLTKLLSNDSIFASQFGGSRSD